MGTNSARRAALFLTVLAIGSATRAAIPLYSVQVVGLEMSPNLGYVQGMNDQGQICYWSDTHSNGTRAYLWDGQQNILLPTTSDNYTQPTDINNSGQIAGFMYPFPGASTTAVIWNQGVLQSLGTFGGLSSWAFSINDQGTVAGKVETSSQQYHLFTWDGTFHDQGNLPTLHHEVKKINSQGQIIGLDAGPLMDGWIWQNGQYTMLPDQQGGAFADPEDMNDSGLVVGMSWVNQVKQLPVTWQNAQLSLLSLAPLATQGRALAVNNLNQIVGFCNVPNVSDEACLWSDGNVYTLSDRIVGNVPWQLRQAWEINDNGQILCLGNAGFGDRELLLTPVPEPASGVVLFLGLLGMGLRRHRRQSGR